MASCHTDWVARPDDMIPVGCGTSLSMEQQHARFAYYMSLIILLTLAAGFIGSSLTLLGRGIRKILIWAQSNVSRSASRTVSRIPYAYAPLQNELEDGANWLVILHVVLSHASCAAISGWAVASDHLNIQNGLCWELWLGWMAPRWLSGAL